MYVAVKGGEKAIANAHHLQADLRRGDRAVAELSCDQIAQQLGLAVDRVMTEGGIYDPALAALAIKQASGDLVEAIFYCAPIAQPCLAWRKARRWTPATCGSSGVSPRFIRICLAVRF